MKYNFLSEEQRAAVVEGRLRQTEADHYNIDLQLGQVEASNNDPNAVEELKNRKEIIEAQIKFLREEASKLPDPPSSTNTVAPSLRPSVG